jgi:hypothetical protein
MLTIPVSQIEEENKPEVEDGYLQVEENDPLRATSFTETIFKTYISEIFGDLLWRDSESERVSEKLLSRFAFKEVRPILADPLVFLTAWLDIRTPFHDYRHQRRWLHNGRRVL